MPARKPLCQVPHGLHLFVVRGAGQHVHESTVVLDARQAVRDLQRLGVPGQAGEAPEGAPRHHRGPEARLLGGPGQLPPRPRADGLPGTGGLPGLRRPLGAERRPGVVVADGPARHDELGRPGRLWRPQVSHHPNRRAVDARPDGRAHAQVYDGGDDGTPVAARLDARSPARDLRLPRGQQQQHSPRALGQRPLEIGGLRRRRLGRRRARPRQDPRLEPDPGRCRPDRGTQRRRRTLGRARSPQGPPPHHRRRRHGRRGGQDGRRPPRPTASPPEPLPDESGPVQLPLPTLLRVSGRPRLRAARRRLPDPPHRQRPHPPRGQGRPPQLHFPRLHRCQPSPAAPGRRPLARLLPRLPARRRRQPPRRRRRAGRPGRAIAHAPSCLVDGPGRRLAHQRRGPRRGPHHPRPRRRPTAPAAPAAARRRTAPAIADPLRPRARRPLTPRLRSMHRSRPPAPAPAPRAAAGHRASPGTASTTTRDLVQHPGAFSPSARAERHTSAIVPPPRGNSATDASFLFLAPSPSVTRGRASFCPSSS
mmetsp:Transcript_6868/g.17982  ORF Transcript_6868/g.17982 Transcript_6868/m.17982 type:complete len:535 (+) Transcript_6868:399-2003(+)